MRWWLRASAQAAALVAVFGTVNAAPAHSRPPIEVNGRRILLGSPTWDVADALFAADVVVRPGALRSAVTGRILRPGASAPVIRVDGQPAAMTTPVRPFARVQVWAGADRVEGLVGRRATGSQPGLPAVETGLWRPGRPSAEWQVVGELSGEVVSRTEVDAGAAAQPETDKVVALTFDDGPDPRFTPAVLDVLRDEGVPATFCAVGAPARRFPELVRAEVAGGNTLCDHTIHHPRHLPARAHNEIVDEVATAADILGGAAGERPALFRAPYGELSPELVDVAHQVGLRVLGWSVDSRDYTRPPPEAITARILAGIRPGGVVLLHDGGGDRSRTVAALRPIIDGLKAQGYTFSTPSREPPADAVAYPPPAPAPAAGGYR